MFYQQIIQEIIHSTFADIRAEAVIADLIENGLQTNEFIVHHNGLFKRRYARDISHIQTNKLEPLQEILEFYINRDGLYDALPEGLFHTKTGPGSERSGKLSNDSQLLKQEEKAARKFFLPFEHELFYQGVLLELKERKILGSFNENIFNHLYPNLWKLHHSINHQYIYRMILMLHISHTFIGKYDRVADSLEKILEEPVKVQIANSDSKNLSILENSDDAENTLGKGKLGKNTVCGNFIDQSVPIIEFIIGPLQNTQPEDYLPDEPIERFLKCFYGYFIPIEMDVQTTVEVDKGKMKFTLAEQGESLVLGYETAI